MRRFLFIVIISLFPGLGMAQEIRGLYVNKVDQILGDSLLEAELVRYVQECRFNHLAFYSLSKVSFSNSLKKQQLRALLRKLRLECKVKRIAATGENFEFFQDKIHAFNLEPETDPDERFDVYNLEFEFWSESAIRDYYYEKYLAPAGFPATEDGAFDFVKKTLLALQAMKEDLPGLETEIYIGAALARHSAQLSGIVDRVLPAVYVSAKADGSVNIYDYPAQRQRLKDLASGGSVTIVPIFNGDKDSYDADLYPWLQTGHTVCEPWHLYLKGFDQESDPLVRQNIHLAGYQWFKYSGMPPVPVLLEPPGPIIGPEFPAVGQTITYEIPQPFGADEIRWTQVSTGFSVSYDASETLHSVVFTAPGPDTLVVQTFACGTKSAEVSFPVVASDPGTGINGKEPFSDTPVFAVIPNESALQIQILDPLPESGLLAIFDAMGRKILVQELAPGYPATLSVPASKGLFLVCFYGKSVRKVIRVVR